MNSTLTVKDLVEFVNSHKTTKSFIDCSLHDIIHEIKVALTDETLFYKLDNTNKICGMIIAIKDDNTKTLNVTRNLSMSLETLKEFAKKAKQQWPDYKLEAIRYGKPMNNSKKLYTKLLQ